MTQCLAIRGQGKFSDRPGDIFREVVSISLWEFPGALQTKQNQADQECSLTVDVDVKVNADLEIDWIKFTVTIPKDDKRLERLFSTRFLLGTSGSIWTWRVIIPIKPSETIKSSKTFEVNVHRSELHDSYVEFNRRWQDQTLSTNDVSYLKL